MVLDMNDVNVALTGLFVNIYNKYKGENKTYIPNTSVAKITMIQVYESFIKEGILISIEKLSFEDKMSLVDECRATGATFTNETLIQQSKILHVIRTINNCS